MLHIEQWNFMLLKRNISKCQHSQAQQLINKLKNNINVAQDQWVAALMDERVGQLFADLHLHITKHNLYHLKAYQAVSDGLYVILKGQISYTYQPNQQGKRVLRRNGPSNTLLTQPWTVFQCCFKNCATLEETYLLRVGQEQAQLANFHENYEQRKQLYERQYLSQDHQSLVKSKDSQPLLVDLRIHSNFSYRSFHFREVIALETPGILSQGRAKLKATHMQSHEFDRFGVLLPGLKYEVTSSEAKIMVIHQNETLVYLFELIKQTINAEKNKINNLRSFLKTENITSLHQYKKEEEQRCRDLGKLFKQSEQYSIISTFLCQKSLAFAKKHNALHCTKKKRQGRYKNPLILFSLTNHRSKLVLPAFHDLNLTEQPPIRESCHKSANSQSAILRKLRLPPADYARFIQKRKLKTSQTVHLKTGNSKKRNINLTFERGIQCNRESQQEQFVPYNKI